MRLAGFATVLLLLGAVAPAQAVSETAEGFAAAMQGCWNRSTWSAAIEAQRADPEYSISSQMCLSGGVEGVLTVLDCGGVNNLVECSSLEGRYEFRDDKFWRGVDGQWDSCDVLLEPGKQVILKNCAWIDPPPAVEPIENAVYERAIGQ